jgi:hypothetical protein
MVARVSIQFRGNRLGLQVRTQSTDSVTPECYPTPTPPSSRAPTPLRRRQHSSPTWTHFQPIDCTDGRNYVPRTSGRSNARGWTPTESSSGLHRIPDPSEFLHEINQYPRGKGASFGRFWKPTTLASKVSWRQDRHRGPLPRRTHDATHQQRTAAVDSGRFQRWHDPGASGPGYCRRFIPADHHSSASRCLSGHGTVPVPGVRVGVERHVPAPRASRGPLRRLGRVGSAVVAGRAGEGPRGGLSDAQCADGRQPDDRAAGAAGAGWDRVASGSQLRAAISVDASPSA